MMHIRYGLIVALAMLSMPAAAQDDIHEGRWRYTSVMQMEGMPAMPKMPEGVQLPPGMTMPQMMPGGMSSSYETCITKQSLVPHDPQHERNCHMDKLKQTGSQISWQASCELPNGGKAESSGEGRYSGDSSQMKVSTTMIQGGHTLRMNMDVRGQYLGPCN